jgi:hypothetical protein
MWTRTARLVAAGLLTALALSGCGGDEADTANDPEPRETATPTVGTYPEFEPQDYRYTLVVSCFCPDAGVPVRVTVEGGEVTEAVYARAVAGMKKGDPAPEHRELTINDVIAEINAATEAESVRVEWPEGQDHPDQVYIDQSRRIADEEIGYTISAVQVG